MTNENATTKEETKMEMYLAEWNTHNEALCDLLEAIDRLTDHKHPYAVSFLAADLVKVAEERQEALENLKEYGIRNHEDALFTVCKRKEAKKENA